MIDLTCPITDISPLIPHSGEMVMLDKITEFGEDYLIAEMTVKPDCQLLKDGKLATYMGAEILAQGVAAWAGCKCVKAGQPIGLGYWIGSRKLTLHRQDISVGSLLQIQIKRSIEDATGFGVFDCTLIDLSNQQPLVEGALNVFRPQVSQELVTGSSRGIGKAIALRLAQSGFDIVVHCRSRIEEAEEVAQSIRELGRQARVLQFDVSHRNETAEKLLADVESHGAYYGVVLNAGLTRDNAFPALTDEDWDVVLRTNLDGFYNVLHPIMMPMIRRRKAGRIVCITSVSGLIGNRGQVNYSASKAGIIGAAKALAVELAKRKITVNCVAPGLIDTDILEENLPIDEILKMIPAARMGSPEEVAHAVDFLMDEKAAYITRQVIAVNGGLC